MALTDFQKEKIKNDPNIKVLPKEYYEPSSNDRSQNTVEPLDQIAYDRANAISEKLNSNSQSLGSGVVSSSSNNGIVNAPVDNQKLQNKSDTQQAEPVKSLSDGITNTETQTQQNQQPSSSVKSENKPTTDVINKSVDKNGNITLSGTGTSNPSSVSVVENGKQTSSAYLAPRSDSQVNNMYPQLGGLGSNLDLNKLKQELTSKSLANISDPGIRNFIVNRDMQNIVNMHNKQNEENLKSLHGMSLANLQSSQASMNEYNLNQQKELEKLFKEATDPQNKNREQALQAYSLKAGLNKNDKHETVHKFTDPQGREIGYSTTRGSFDPIEEYNNKRLNEYMKNNGIGDRKKAEISLYMRDNKGTTLEEATKKLGY